MSVIQDVEQAIGNIVHHTRNAIDVAVKDAEARFTAEKTAIGAEVRAAVKAAEGAVSAETPELRAALDAAVKAVERAVEAALAARGL